jgi:DnaA family protein
MNQQLALDLIQPLEPSLDNFVPGANAEALAALRAAAAGAGPSFIYLWGAQGCGRTHLLHAMVAPPLADMFNPEQSLYAIDDVDRLDAAGEQRLFNLANEVRAASGTTLIAAGNAPPAQLALRPDVRTRLAWGLVYQLHPLSDVDKAQALATHAASRGIALSPEVVAFMLNHMPRDMRTQIAVLDALDAAALAAKRTITVPLVREWLQGRLHLAP